ncbi:MAG: PDZ domain-containing protein [Planctomycetota bacterium]|nr:PDZ domain-containing protein [Planctomycetota bacterium]
MFRRSFKPGLVIISLILVANIAASAGKPYLGISLAAKIPPAIAAHLEIDGGAMIIAVVEDSPAARAGLKKHDIIIKAAGQEVKSAADLRKALDSEKPNANEDTLALVVRRGPKTLDFKVKPTDAPAKKEPPKNTPERSRPQASKKAYLGVNLDAIPASLAVHLRLARNQGVLVDGALPGSPAHRSGLKKHDIILEVGGKAVTSSGRRTGSRSIIIPSDLEDLQLGGIRGGITGGLRIESLQSLLGESRDRTSSNLNQLISAHRPGEEVELEVIQRGARKKIMVVLAAAPTRKGSVFPPRRLGGPGSSSSSISSVTVNDGDLSITVRNANGKKTFSVRRGKEVLAKDEPWDALDKLPAEIQEKVRRLNSGPAGKPKNDKGSEPLPPGEKKLPPGKESKKPI